jgi:hypothetical protein
MPPLARKAWLCWSCILLLSSSLCRAASESPATPLQDRFLVRFETPFVVQRIPSVPTGFEGDALLAPFNLVLGWKQVPEPQRAAFSIEANATFPRYSLIPAIGVTPGITLSPRPGLVLQGALDFQDQETVEKAPFSNSQFDTFIVSALAGIRYDASPWVTVGLSGRYASFAKNQLANFESLETDIDHKGTFALSPWLALHLPLDLEFNAQLDFYDLGNTAIASKEFAFSIASQWVQRLGLALERRFGSFGVDVHYYWVSGYRDPVELAYQAPFLYRDYLLSPQTLTVGVSWHP